LINQHCDFELIVLQVLLQEEGWCKIL